MLNLTLTAVKALNCIETVHQKKKKKLAFVNAFGSFERVNAHRRRIKTED